MKTLRLLFAVCCLTMLLTACTTRSPNAESNLEGETWVLVNLNGSDPLEGRQLILQFDSGQVSGNGGCNQYGGSYQITGEAIRFYDLFSTEMACMDPEGIMKQEQIYLELLQTANRFELVDGELIFFVDQQPILRYNRE
jgi:heat shock protein HslJ